MEKLVYASDGELVLKLLRLNDWGIVLTESRIHLCIT
jgi:hypothetical protein